MQTRWKPRDYAAALVLFVATFAFVLWQNHRVAIIWDLSYILDSAYRVSIGQVLYRDLPFAHAPLTFLLQAAIMRITGRIIFHHILYAATAGALGTVLTWRIGLRILKSVRDGWLMATLLAAPLAVAGIYSILPIPFYDCDCVLSILAGLYLLYTLNAHSSARRSLLTGAALILPAFFKQNIGLPFLLTALAGLSLLILVRLATKPGAPRLDSEMWVSTRALTFTLTGAVSAFVAAALVLHLTVGAGNYLHWTVTFAAQRRMPGLQDMLAVYAEPSLRWTIPGMILGLMLWRRSSGLQRLKPSDASGNGGTAEAVPLSEPPRDRWFQLVGLLLFASPFLRVLYALTQTQESDDRAASLLALWPLLLILAAAQALWSLRKGTDLRILPPILMLAAIHGTLLSQQLWGSTYALWPLLMLLIAGMLASLAPTFTTCHPEPSEGPAFSSGNPNEDRGLSTSLRSGRDDGRWLPVLAAIIAVTVTIAGALYAASEERLSYSSVLDGPIERSALPALKGLSAHGPFLPAFDQLVRFTGREIPHDDGILLLNGEDPFFFATGRVPQFPILLFDPATDPYSPQQVIEQVRAHNIRWLILKRGLQIKEDPTPHRAQTVELLRQEFRPYATLDNYEIYRRAANPNMH